MRNIVMSDTGGWLPQLLASFDELGVNAEEGTIPTGLRFIHAGDLIHKGPFSSELIEIVTKLMVNNPGKWIQLMGNHEAQHIPGAPVFWNCDCTPHDVGALNEWRKAGFMKPTYALKLTSGKFQVTGRPELVVDSPAVFFSHGGLTEGFWEWTTAADSDALQVSEKLNVMPIHEVTAPGLMLGENKPPSRVGPVWAIGNSEVFPSWRQTPQRDMPFTQFHGHTTSYSYDWKRWWPGLEVFRSYSAQLPESRAIVTELNNNLMLGVDPGFSERVPLIGKQPWVEFWTAN